MKSFNVPTSFKNGRYVARRVLGTGTYGQVIQCVDTLSNSDCAVKVAQRDPAYRRSALNEIRALQALQDSPDSVQMLDSFEDNGHVCIATELLDRNIFEILRSRGYGPLPLRDVRRVALHVFRALDSLHCAGYMHCDIKPENIMLRLKLTSSGYHNSSPVLGTPASATGGPNTSMFSFTNINGSTVNKVIVNNNSTSRLSWATNSSNSSNPVEALTNARPPAFYAMLGEAPPSFQVHTQLGAHPPANIGSSQLNINNGVQPMPEGSSSEEDFYFSPCQGSFSPSSLLNEPYSAYDRTCLIDFGAVRQFHENAYYDVQSLWYRAPEVLCGVPYTPMIDSWSMGCLLFEIYTGRALFPGTGIESQMEHIVHMMGNTSEGNLRNGKNAGSFKHLVSRAGTNAAEGAAFARHLRTSRAAGIARLRTHIQRHQPDASKESSLKTNQGGIDLGYIDPSDLEELPTAAAEEDSLIQLIVALLQPDELHRLDCGEALRHPFFQFGSAQTSAQCGPSGVLLPPMILPVSMAEATSPPSVTLYCPPISATGHNDTSNVNTTNTTMTLGGATTYTQQLQQISSSLNASRSVLQPPPHLLKVVQPQPIASLYNVSHSTHGVFANTTSSMHTTGMSSINGNVGGNNNANDTGAIPAYGVLPVVSMMPPPYGHPPSPVDGVVYTSAAAAKSMVANASQCAIRSGSYNHSVSGAHPTSNRYLYQEILPTQPPEGYILCRIPTAVTGAVVAYP